MSNPNIIHEVSLESLLSYIFKDRSWIPTNKPHLPRASRPCSRLCISAFRWTAIRSFYHHFLSSLYSVRESNSYFKNENLTS